MSKQVVIARIQVIEGKENEYLSLVEPLIEASKTESGSFVYSLYQSTQNPTEFMVYEEYVDEKAFNEHCQTELFQAFGVKVKPLLAKEIDIQIY
ncbi:MAG TPA: antibiotic biosynthesis monooxygenase [Bacteroides reticulotermitis]|nr:antibiotic biosynthesis monooxygenase [Bacteroides reticulotermitis]